MMTCRNGGWLWVALVAFVAGPLTSHAGGKFPDYADLIKDGHAQKMVTDKNVTRRAYNLGPTGMRGWMYVEENRTEKARQILVTVVDKGSPADGVIEVGDVILGAGGKLFSEDARRAFGMAIGEAEKEERKGILKLVIWRNSKQQNVDLKLRVMGTYSDTAPYDCPKSKKILEEGCRLIAEKQDFGQKWVGGLALLASGNPEYAEMIKARAREAGDPSLKFSVAEGQPGAWGSWGIGYTCLFLSEYHLATGDDYVLPAINEYANLLGRGQSGVGTWGHGLAWTIHNDGVMHGPLGGYGALNQAGLVNHIALVLAKKCGVKDPEVDQAIAKANAFFS